MGARFWSLVTLQSLKLLILFKNYFSVAPVQNHFLSQGKVFCFSGEHCTPSTVVVAMAVC